MLTLTSPITSASSKVGETRGDGARLSPSSGLVSVVLTLARVSIFVGLGRLMVRYGVSGNRCTILAS